jgi:hypothetical protein
VPGVGVALATGVDVLVRTCVAVAPGIVAVLVGEGVAEAICMELFTNGIKRGLEPAAADTGAVTPLFCDPKIRESKKAPSNKDANVTNNLDIFLYAMVCLRLLMNKALQAVSQVLAWRR